MSWASIFSIWRHWKKESTRLPSSHQDLTLFIQRQEQEDCRHSAQFTFSGRRLSIRVSHALHSSRRNADRHADLLPQDWGWQVHYRHVPEHPGVQLPSDTEKQNKTSASRLELRMSKSRFSCYQKKKWWKLEGRKQHKAAGCWTSSRASLCDPDT